MNTPNPLAPGATPTKGRSNVQIFVFSIVAVHVLFIAGMMMQGCKDNTPPAPQPMTNHAPDTAMAPPVSTNPIVALPTNPPVALPTNPVVVPPTPLIETPTNPPPTGSTKEYVIAKGDTLGTVAKKYHVTLKALKDANAGLNEKKLQIGAKIKIPDTASTAVAGTGSTTDTGATGDTATYTVKTGDALEKIAKKNGTTVKAIVELNHLKSMNSIKVGQKLKLPASKSAATVAAPDTTATAPAPVAPPVVAPAPVAPPVSTGTTTN